MTLRAFTIKHDKTPERPILRKSGIWPALTGEAPSAASTHIDLPTAPTAVEDASPAPESTPALAAALEAIEGAHQELQERMRFLEAEYQLKCASTLARIISAAAPAICEAAARDAIAAIFDKEPTRPSQDLLTIAASADLMAVIREECRERSNAIDIQEDGSLPPGSFRCRWAGGGLESDVGTALLAIVEALTNPMKLDAKDVAL